MTNKPDITNPSANNAVIPNPYNPELAQELLLNTTDDICSAMNAARILTGFSSEDANDTQAASWLASELLANLTGIYSNIEIARQFLMTDDQRKFLAAFDAQRPQ